MPATGDETTFLEKMHSQELNWACYVPLIFSLFYFVPFVWKEYQWYEYVIMLLAYVAFVVFFTLCRLLPRYAGAFIIGMAAMGVLVSPLNIASYCLIWYGASYAGYLYTPKQTVLWVVGLAIAVQLAATFADFPRILYSIYGTLPCIAMALFGWFDQKVLKEEAIKKEKNKQIEQLAAIAERERLVRDMHDVLGHNLTALSLKAQLASKLGRNGELEAALNEIDEIATIAGSALSDVRAAITQYKKKGFSEQVSSLVQQLEASGFNVHHEIPPSAIEPHAEAHLILILTEAVTNILRHSDGDRATIVLQKDVSRYTLTVSDNGSAQQFTAGNGIKGVRERIQEMGGDFHIGFENGFTLQVSVP